MFPIVVLLALSGLVVGMLNSFEHFAVPALAPVAWNLVIIAALVGLVPVLPEDDEIYAYAIGILAGTVVQFLLPLPWLRGRGGTLTLPARLARRARAARAQADAAGDDRARADQPQPADQLAVRHARVRPGAGGDRQGVPDLPAAAGAVLDLDRDDPVPDAVALRRPRGARRPAPHDGQRRAPDLPAADPERGADGGAGRADHAARLPARRLRRRGHRPHLDGDGLVVDLAALPGREPAVLAHLLQPPAAVGDHRAGRAQPGRQRRRWPRRCTGRSRSPGSCSARWSGRWRCAWPRAGCCAASSAGSRARARSARGAADAAAAALLGAGRLRRSGTGSTRRWARPARAAVAVLGALAAGVAVYAAAVWALRRARGAADPAAAG